MNGAPHEESSSEKLSGLRKVMEENIPFNRVLGVSVAHLTEGRAIFAVPFREELIGDPKRPALHGGVLSAVADAAGGAAVWSRIGVSDRVSTIDLRVDYLRPAQLSTFHADAEVLRVGNRVGVARIRVFHPDEPDKTVAEAKGVYSIHRPRQRQGGNDGAR